MKELERSDVGLEKRQPSPKAKTRVVFIYTLTEDLLHTGA